MTAIREAMPADLERVSALDAALFGSDGWSLAAMAAEFAVGGGTEAVGGTGAVGGTRTVLVATSGAEVVGYAILSTVGDVADIHRIGIAAGWQRRGLGGRLLEELVSRAAAAGHPKVLLEVAAHNAAALALYHRHGFVEVGRRRGYYRDGDDALVMARKLPS